MRFFNNSFCTTEKNNHLWPSEIFMKFEDRLLANAIRQPFNDDYFRKSVVKCSFLLTSILTFYMETGK